ncbi:hypothetical protein MSPP1_001787 [Malassezia sp. CBS 17886]|nr:hypothetical protein MSPP1_001787 [Malassezia sp. CBS 17886]
MANELVRMAVLNEYRRQPVRRDEVTRTVTGKEASRVFPVVFAAAQDRLRATFAMELVELRARGAENPLLVQQALALDARIGEKRAHTPEDAAAPSNSSARAFVLRSTLPADVTAAMATPDSGHRALLDWRYPDGQLGTIGLLFLVLSIVLCSGRRIPDARLRAHLAQLSLSLDRVLPLGLQPLGSGSPDETLLISSSQHAASAGAELLTLDSFLSLLQRQGYLEKTHATSSADADRTNARSAAFEWRWGARAEAEIGENAVAAFIEQVYGTDKGPKREEGGVGERTGRSVRVSQEELRRQMEHAAGSPLVG